MFSRRTRDCESHEWVSTLNAGLRRDLCVVCGRIRMESVEVVTTRLPLFAEARVGETSQRFGVALDG